MKSYVVITGAVFGLLVLVHIWRAIVEGMPLVRDPFYVIITLASAAFCFWAWRVFRLMKDL